MGAAGSIPHGILESLPERVALSECAQVFGHETIRTRFELFKDADSLVAKALIVRIMQHKYDVFLTHNWSNDELGRSNHERVAKVNAQLKARGFTTWFDEERMHGSIIEQMCNGIDDSYCVVAFITKEYITKVGSQNDKDNCKLEFNYAHRKKGPSLMIPAVMEPSVLNANAWDGSVGIVLGGHLYIDLTKDTPESISALADSIVSTMKRSVDSHSAPHITSTASSSQSLPPAAPSTAAPSLSPVPAAAAQVSVVKGKPLHELSTDEVLAVLTHLKLAKYVSEFHRNEVTGSVLAECACAEEIKELGITITAQARVLFTKLSEYKSSGVPDEVLRTPVLSIAHEVAAAPATSHSGAAAVEAHPVAAAEVTKQVTFDDYPKTIEMSGCPLLHAGWNGVYTRQGDRAHNGYPVFRLPPHQLLFVSIIGADILFDGNQWILHRDGDSATMGMHSGPCGPSPIGIWDSDITVR